MIDLLLEVFNKRDEIDERCRGLVRHYCELYLDIFRTHFYTPSEIEEMSDFYIDKDFQGNTILSSPGINGCCLSMRDLTHPKLEDLLKAKYIEKQQKDEADKQRRLEHKRALYAKLRSEFETEDRTLGYN